MEIFALLCTGGWPFQQAQAALGAERAQLAVILAGTGDAVLVVDRAGTIVLTNAAHTRMAGDATVPLTPQDAQGQPLPADQTPQVRAARGETFSLEFTVTRPRLAYVVLLYQARDNTQERSL